jgi:hypothetical protein
MAIFHFLYAINALRHQETQNRIYFFPVDALTDLSVTQNLTGF